MALWTSSEIEKATGGTVHSKWIVNGISIDTRTLQEGDLFVALSDKRDGHNFVEKAFEKGATAALVSYIPDGLTDVSKLVLVSDVLEGLRSMAIEARDRFKGKLIAVTGSVGKTSTKDMLRLALNLQGTVHASDKSYNNHWGVPLTLARMPKNTDFAIVEMGMNKSGEIRAHSILSRPHIALITAVKKVHMSNFRSLQEIAVAKLEIFSGLEIGGLALVNSEIEKVVKVEDYFESHQGALYTFGFQDADWVLNRPVIQGNSLEVEVTHGLNKFSLVLNSLGEHFALNGLAAIAVVSLLKMNESIAIQELRSWQPMEGRGQRTRVNLMEKVGDHYFDIIDDAYNSNPTSLRASFKLLNELWKSKKFLNHKKRRKIAMLGDMLELGKDEILIHKDIATWAEIRGIDKFYLVGDLMKSLFDSLPPESNKFWFKSYEKLNDILLEEISEGDIILIKGSKKSNMSKVVSDLKNINKLPERDKV